MYFVRTDKIFDTYIPLYKSKPLEYNTTLYIGSFTLLTNSYEIKPYLDILNTNIHNPLYYLNNQSDTIFEIRQFNDNSLTLRLLINHNTNIMYDSTSTIIPENEVDIINLLDVYNIPITNMSNSLPKKDIYVENNIETGLFEELDEFTLTFTYTKNKLTYFTLLEQMMLANGYSIDDLKPKYYDTTSEFLNDLTHIDRLAYNVFTMFMHLDINYASPRHFESPIINIDTTNKLFGFVCIPDDFPSSYMRMTALDIDIVNADDDFYVDILIFNSNKSLINSYRTFNYIDRIEDITNTRYILMKPTQPITIKLVPND